VTTRTPERGGRREPPRPDPQLRLRSAIPALVTLPWLTPLGEWSAAEVEFRDVPVGPSRHLVRFVEAGDRLWALKELPVRVAEREYQGLRGIEERHIPAVKVAGLAVRPDSDDAVLITEYLEGSWQYRRLLLRIPLDEQRHRARLLDAVASLLVDLHRRGVFWGDCSLANTLFKRDGQRLQAYLVDAETTEVHESLSDGQRRADLAIVEENIGGGMLDMAMRLGADERVVDQLLDEARSVPERYEELWSVLHDQPTFSYADRHEVVSRIRRLNDLGFAVDEVRLVQVAPGQQEVRLNAVVTDRRFHADELRRLTGLDVGEGQATLLLNDLRGHAARRGRGAGPLAREDARAWLLEVFQPALSVLRLALPDAQDLVQTYCDLLEIRWLMSEQAGRDVGDEPAVLALTLGEAPRGSAAEMAVAEATTGALPVVVAGEDDDVPASVSFLQ